MQAKQENLITALWQFAAILLLVCLKLADQASAVGVAYGRVGDNLPSPKEVVALLQSNGFKDVMIYDTEPQVLQAFMMGSGSNGISLIVQATNSELQALAASPAIAAQWVQSRIVPYASIIKYISVGNEVLTGDPSNSQYLLPAMNNVNQAVASAGLQGSIKVSTTHATAVLGVSYPPSQGRFADAVQANMESILQLLRANGAPFMANVYPFLAYKGSTDIDLGYALGEAAAGSSSTVEDNGLRYTSLFDAQVDALVSAMEAAGGYGDVGIMVTESGWPSAGDAAATVQNARTYIGNLIPHQGTPKRPNPPFQAYIFALFNENQKDGPEYERHFGLFNPDQTKVYDCTI